MTMKLLVVFLLIVQIMAVMFARWHCKVLRYWADVIKQKCVLLHTHITTELITERPSIYSSDIEQAFGIAVIYKTL